MQIVMTGGTGLIGAALAAQLAATGNRVWVLSRAPRQAHLPPGVEALGWDGRTPQGWGHLVAEADALINLAGESIGAGRWSEARLERIRSSRVQAGQALLEAVRQARRRPAVLLQASAVGYYGTCGDEWIDEDSPAGSDRLAGICQDWEASTQPVEALGVRRVVLRTGIVLSARQGALPRMLLPFRWMVGGPLGSGRQWLPWIALADQVAGMDFLLRDPAAQGVFNLCAPEPATNAAFGRTLAAVLRRPYWLPAPAFALRLLLGEMSTLVLDGQRARPQRLLQAGYRFRFASLRPALEALLA